MEKKGEDIVCIDMKKINHVFFDYFIAGDDEPNKWTAAGAESPPPYCLLGFYFFCTIDEFDLTSHIIADAGEISVIL